MNIKVFHMITGEYIICDAEELDEEPSVHMKNPYLITDLTFWDTDDEPSSVAPENAVFLNRFIDVSLRHNGKDTEQIEYAELNRYPKFGSDTSILFNSDKILTIFDPLPGILNLYTQLISK